MANFIKKYKYLLIVVLFLLIVSISFFNYKNTREIIKDKYKNRKQLVEQSILKSIAHINDAYRIAEKQLNSDMEKYSLQLIEKYRKNPDISSWNLKQLKKKFGGYDIYIINQNLKVIRSTFKKDIGLDFKQFPSFSRLLQKRLQGSSFAVDRLDLETRTGDIKKYSYMPTPDHKYLLELGLDIGQKFPVLKDLNIFNEALNLTEKYDSVKKISFYKYGPETGGVGILRSSKNPVSTDISGLEKELVKKAFESGQKQSAKQSVASDYSYTFIPAFVPRNNDKTNWWNSFVVGITYNNEMMLAEINKTRNLFLINGLIMVGVFIIFIVIVIYLLNRFEYMAYHDQLTGLPTRKLFMEKAEKMMTATTKKQDKLAILFIDINNFKEVNDNFGHDTGDKILDRAAARLKNGLRKCDQISRPGGDEFTIAVAEVSSREEVKEIADRIIKLFNEPLEINESKFFISISIGISIYPEQSNRLEELIKKADYAMYKAKQQQKDMVMYNEGI